MAKWFGVAMRCHFNFIMSAPDAELKMGKISSLSSLGLLPTNVGYTKVFREADFLPFFSLFFYLLSFVVAFVYYHQICPLFCFAVLSFSLFFHSMKKIEWKSHG